jgi:hypothetical protein
MSSRQPAGSSRRLRLAAGEPAVLGTAQRPGKNERLEKFLLKTFRTGGIDALKSQFGVECEPRPFTPACNDCYVCRGKLSKQVAPQEDEPFEYRCSKSGEMLVEMDIGPRPESFSVMTYWKRPSLPPKAGK